jgi:hypothetical protein
MAKGRRAARGALSDLRRAGGRSFSACYRPRDPQHLPAECPGPAATRRGRRGVRVAVERRSSGAGSPDLARRPGRCGVSDFGGFLAAAHVWEPPVPLAIPRRHAKRDPPLVLHGGVRQSRQGAAVLRSQSRAAGWLHSVSWREAPAQGRLKTGPTRGIDPGNAGCGHTAEMFANSGQLRQDVPRPLEVTVCGCAPTTACRGTTRCRSATRVACVERADRRRNARSSAPSPVTW